MSSLVLPACRLIMADVSDRDAWLAERRKGLGASDMSTIAGVNPYGSLYELWLDKTGRREEKKPTRRMMLGNILEPVVRQVFQIETGLTVDTAGLMESLDVPIFRASPDGLIHSERAGFEAKTVNWRSADAWKAGEVADHAEIQAQASMAVTGLDRWACAAIIDGDPDDFHWAWVHRDQALIDTLWELGQQFWHDYVVKDTPPPVDGNALAALREQFAKPARETTEADPGDVAEALGSYRAAMAMERTAKSQKNAAQARLIELAGDAEVVTAKGEIAFTYKQTTRKGYTVKESTFRQLYVPAQKGA